MLITCPKMFTPWAQKIGSCYVQEASKHRLRGLLYDVRGDGQVKWSSRAPICAIIPWCLRLEAIAHRLEAIATIGWCLLFAIEHHDNNVPHCALLLASTSNLLHHCPDFIEIHRVCVSPSPFDMVEVCAGLMFASKQSHKDIVSPCICPPFGIGQFSNQWLNFTNRAACSTREVAFEEPPRK